MTETNSRDLPAEVRQWLDDNRIPLDPDDRGQGIWAEWDHRQELRLGWWGEVNCRACGQPDRPERSLIVPAGFGDHNWQHSCGTWWAPFRSCAVVVPDPLRDDDVPGLLTDLDDELGWLHQQQQQTVDLIIDTLTFGLRSFLEQHRSDEDRDQAATGNDVEPGIWRNDAGRWEAWAYDPRDPTCTVAFDEDNLANEPDVEVWDARR